jgi:hypothetical protein
MRLNALVLVFVMAGCGGSGRGGFTTGHPPTRQPPANAVGGFTIQLPDVVLPPGGEVQPCYIFPLDVTGPSHVVGGATLDATPGMHHGNITTRPKTGDGIRACSDADSAGGSEALDILNGGGVLFGSSTQIVGQEWQSFPAGMGYRIKEGYEIVARMHYLNASTAPLTVAPSYQWYTIDESTLQNELAPFIWEYKNFTIPAGATVTVTGDCQFPFADHPMHLVNVLPHMHKLGIEFDAAVTGGPLDGQAFLKSPGYNPDQGVLMQYDPAVDLGAVGGVTFDCTWHNTLGQDVVEGVGINEMCMMFGYAYPPSAAYSALAGQGTCVMSTP